MLPRITHENQGYNEPVLGPGCVPSVRFLIGGSQGDGSFVERYRRFNRLSMRLARSTGLSLPNYRICRFPSIIRNYAASHTALHVGWLRILALCSQDLKCSDIRPPANRTVKLYLPHRRFSGRSSDRYRGDQCGSQVEARRLRARRDGRSWRPMRSTS